MKLVALACLLVAAIVYVITEIDGGDGWVGYVRAFAEAAMVGALADWFAVTALFRHPLGIPIPHTAIIPRRKEQIGRSLGDFVETNFLTHEVLGERLADGRLSERLGTWLSAPVNARRAAGALTDAVRASIEVLDDDDVQSGVEQMVERRVRATPAAPLLGRAIDIGIEGGHQRRLLDAVLTGLDGFLDDNRAAFRARLSEESPWWVPGPLDDRVFAKVYGAVGRFIADVRTHPDHEIRHSIDRQIAEFADRLRTDPVLRAKGESVKEEWLAHPAVRDWIASLWTETRSAVTEAAADESSELRLRVERSLCRFGERLAAEPELQRKVDDWIGRLVRYVVDQYRSEVSDLIAGTVERWDADATSRKIELQVGRDLQFIRINGTIVGGLAGVAIHATSNLL